jgi:hypothetical protein
MIIPSAIRTASHTNHPLRIGHLVVAEPHCGSDLVRHGASDDHHVGLPGGGTEYYAETVLVVTGHGEVHHFDGAASEAETEGPERGLAGPVYELVGCCAGNFSMRVKGRINVGTYRTCSTTFVLLRIVVGTLAPCCDWEEEYDCLCLLDMNSPNGALFCDITRLQRLHWLLSVRASSASALTVKERISNHLAASHAWMHRVV